MPAEEVVMPQNTDWCMKLDRSVQERDDNEECLDLIVCVFLMKQTFFLFTVKKIGSLSKNSVLSDD